MPKMVAAKASIERSLNTLNVRRETRKIVLNEEQETAVSSLLLGNDVLAILPTGFGKSMIYTIFALANQEMRSAKASVYEVVSRSKLLFETKLLKWNH